MTLAHIFFGLIVSLVVLYWFPTGFGLSITILVGLLKETYDWFTNKLRVRKGLGSTNSVEGLNMAYMGVGGFVGELVAILLQVFRGL